MRIVRNYYFGDGRTVIGIGTVNGDWAVFIAPAAGRAGEVGKLAPNSPAQQDALNEHGTALVFASETRARAVLSTLLQQVGPPTVDLRTLATQMRGVACLAEVGLRSGVEVAGFLRNAARQLAEA